MDAAAREMKLDPAELRRRNLIRPRADAVHATRWRRPTTAASSRRSSTRASRSPTGTASRRGAPQSERARQAARPRHRHLSRMDRRQRLRGEGQRRRHAPTASSRSSRRRSRWARASQTSYAQLAVDVFGVPIEQDPHRPGRHRPRQRLRQRRLALALRRRLGGARRLRAHGRARARRSPARRSRRRRPTSNTAPAASTSSAPTSASTSSRSPAGSRTRRIHLDSTSSVGGATWPNACHVCEVEIDPDTGDVSVVAYASVNDIGRVVSPTIARGQVEGGAVQGIGQALCEAVVYDAESASSSPAASWTTRMPRADGGADFRHRVRHLDARARSTRSASRASASSARSARRRRSMNAVIDALDHAGLGRAAEKSPCRRRPSGSGRRCGRAPEALLAARPVRGSRYAQAPLATRKPRPRHRRRVLMTRRPHDSSNSWPRSMRSVLPSR